MAIDVDTEEIITLGEACRAVPPRGVSAATMARWIQRGVRGGGRLETILIGGRRLTSRESLTRFFAAQNAADSSAPQFTATQRQRMASAANRALEAAGL